MFGRFLFVTLLFSFSFTVFGENITFYDFSHFSLRTWSAVSGLPHNNVTSFYRGGNGLVWVGTVEGLARIDSKSSKIFNTSTSSAILSNKINDLSGCGGKVFVATPMGVSEIAGNGAEISKVAGTHSVFDVETLSDCTLFATNGKEIFMTKSSRTNKLSEMPSFPESAVSTLFSDGVTLYAGFENGEIRSFSDGVFSGNLCAGNTSAVTAGKAEEGRAFVGTADGTLWEIKNGRCTKIARSESRKAVTSLDFQGETVVFVSDGSLLFAEDGALKPCGTFCADAGFVSKVMLDNDFVWLAGNRGITLFYPGKFITLGRESGLFSEKVYALIEDNSGRVWAGTRGGGIFFYENGKFKYLKDRKGDVGRFAGGLFQDGDGSILVGTTSGIVSFSPEKPSVFKRMKVEGNGAMPAVSVIFRDRKSRLWAGGGGGAIYLDTKNGWHLLRKFGDDSDFVSAIAQDNFGNLWFAASKGLWQLDKNDEFYEINQGVAGNMPVTLYIDENDIVFVGSMHSGVTLVFPDLKHAQLDSRKGLCSDTILGITADEDGNLWFSSTNGIFSLPKQEVLEAAENANGSVSCTPFDSSDGIRRPESTGGVQPSILKRKNGDLWFPTLEGIAVLKKNGRKPAKFESVMPEENPDIVVKNEKKSNYLWIFVILVVSAAVIAVFVVKRGWRKTSQSASQPAPLPQGSLDGETGSAAEEPGDSELYDVDAEVVENTEENELFDPAADDVEEKRKYEKNRLDDEIAAAYAKEAADLMKSKKLYKNPDLTLPMLAKKLGLSTNILSQVLNGYCGQSFYSFVNTYRISEAIAMMNDPEYENESVIRILTEAGFKSKSSFNTLFKKQTGLTPSEFRQNLKKESEKQ